MKINIDIRNSFNHTGIGSYKRNLVRKLENYNNIEIQGCYNYSRHLRNIDSLFFNCKIKKSYIPDKLIYNKYHLPIYYESMFGGDIDLNLFLTYLLPNVRFRKPVISTIHDLIILKAKNELNSFIELHERQLKYTISKSCHIITVSEASKVDICEYFNIPTENISIVHNGIDFTELNKPISNEEIKVIQKKYNLPDRYILYFGGYRKHKNIENLIKAYSKLTVNERKNYKLVITNKSEILMKMADDYGLSNDIIFTGFIDECDKTAVYKMALMVFYASFYEGFGVPILEAQACRIPVITSSVSSMPEAAGGAALLVNPYSIDDIVNSIRELLYNNPLKEKLIMKGVKNAKMYTWEKAAEELYSVLKKII